MKRILSRLAHDYAYILPGFFISVFAFVLLVPLFALALGTAVVWIGVWLLPIVLLIASGFAELSRSRVRRWGGQMKQPAYRDRGTGPQGVLRYITDSRRWLDLLFETLIAFPLRTVTFVVSVTWPAVALGGLTYVFWGHFTPRGENDFPLFGRWLNDLPYPYLMESMVYFAVGAVFALSLPLVLRGIALLDASTTAAALGADPTSGPAVASWGTRTAADTTRVA